MRAGRLGCRVMVQRPIERRDAYGDNIPAWQSMYQRWAGIEPVRGGADWQAEQETTTQQVKVILRYDRDEAAEIRPDWRIVYAGRAYDIEYVENVGERDDYLALTCIVRQMPPEPITGTMTASLTALLVVP